VEQQRFPTGDQILVEAEVDLGPSYLVSWKTPALIRVRIGGSILPFVSVRRAAP
jgi:hypothetical protein